MKEITREPTTNASGIPTSTMRGHKLAPVVCTPSVTLARRSLGVTSPRNCILHIVYFSSKTTNRLFGPACLSDMPADKPNNKAIFLFLLSYP